MNRPAIILLLSALAMPLYAADIENGADLHFENCTGCHQQEVYTRSDRRVTDLALLGRQVRFCKDNLSLTWFDDEVDDVIAYLNKNYYHF